MQTTTDILTDIRDINIQVLDLINDTARLGDKYVRSIMDIDSDTLTIITNLTTEEVAFISDCGVFLFRPVIPPKTIASSVEFPLPILAKVKEINLTLLVIFRQLVNTDLLDACHRLGLPMTVAKEYEGALSMCEIHALCNCGNLLLEPRFNNPIFWKDQIQASHSDDELERKNAHVQANLCALNAR